MIATKFSGGQGFGNQLFCYVTCRSLAHDKDLDFVAFGSEFFGSPKWNSNGAYFFDLNIKESKLPESKFKEIIEKDKRLYLNNSYHDKNYGCDIRGFDNTVVNCKKFSLISGNLQSEKYFYHNKKLIKKWLRVISDFDSFEFYRENLCIINFRGSEYHGNKELFLDKTYWNNAISEMKKLNSEMEFIVITEDIYLAEAFFPNFKCYHFDLAKDYVTIKNSKYVILSNSSFAFFPVWTSDTIEFIIAPKYWSRHNVSNGYWSTYQNIYKDWNYIDKKGKIFSYNECLKELNLKNINDQYV